MQCFSLIHGVLSQGLQVTDDHIFFGKTGDGCKGYKLKIARGENSPEIIDGAIHDAFCITDQITERPMLVKANRNSSTVLIRVLTIANTGRAVSRVKGKWFQTGTKQEAICTGYGFRRSWVDSLITLRSGNAAIVTMEGGGGKFVVLNFDGRIINAEMKEQHFFEHRHFKSKRQKRKEFEKTKDTHSEVTVETEAQPSNTEKAPIIIQ